MCELLRANLYEFQKYQRENGDEPYFTPPRIQRIAIQVRGSSYCAAVGHAVCHLGPVWCRFAGCHKPQMSRAFHIHVYNASPYR